MATITLKVSIFLLLLGLACGLKMSHAEGDFSYDDQGNWPGSCNTGKKQSPIDFNFRQHITCQTNAFRIKSPHSWVSYRNFAQHNPTLKANFTKSTINFRWYGQTKQYQSVQFHFHVPSEHTFGDQKHAAELHIVHQNSKGERAVYGLLLKGTSRVRYDFLSGLNPYSLKYSIIQLPELDTPQTVYHYKGSLTSPTCDEIVQWFVNPKPLQVSWSSLENLRRLVHGGKPSNRRTQPLNKRQIYNVGTRCKYGRW